MTGNAFTAFRQFCADFVYHFVTSDCTHGLSDSFFLFLRFFRRHWPFDDTLGERRPLHQFQHEKTNAADAPGVKRRSDLNDHTLHAKATWLRTSVAARWRDRVGMVGCGPPAGVRVVSAALNRPTGLHAAFDALQPVTGVSFRVKGGQGIGQGSQMTVNGNTGDAWPDSGPDSRAGHGIGVRCLPDLLQTRAGILIG